MERKEKLKKKREQQKEERENCKLGVYGKTLELIFSSRELLRTKFATKKEMNKCMAEIYDPGGIRTRAARLISQYHNH